MRVFAAILARDLRLSLRHGADTLAALLFFMLTAALFPLAIGPAPDTLGRIAPGIVWVCALLAALLPSTLTQMRRPWLILETDYVILAFGRAFQTRMERGV